MANKHPITIIHQGAKGGILIANNTPVSHALPSLNAGQIGRLRINITAALICEKAKLLGFEANGMLVEPDPAQLDTLLYMVGVGLLKTEIQQVYPMSDVIAAHQQVESGRTRGKVLLDMTC